jgi:hypothetical protein
MGEYTLITQFHFTIQPNIVSLLTASAKTLAHQPWPQGHWLCGCSGILAQLVQTRTNRSAMRARLAKLPL